MSSPRRVGSILHGTEDGNEGRSGRGSRRFFGAAFVVVDQALRDVGSGAGEGFLHQTETRLSMKLLPIYLFSLLLLLLMLLLLLLQ